MITSRTLFDETETVMIKYDGFRKVLKVYFLSGLC
jgi:hypothetical protein